MKTNSRVKKYKSINEIEKASPNQERIVQSESGAIKKLKPSYASMLAAVAKIANPVSFKHLKIFYGLSQ